MYTCGGTKKEVREGRKDQRTLIVYTYEGTKKEVREGRSEQRTLIVSYGEGTKNEGREKEGQLGRWLKTSSLQYYFTI